MEVSVDRRCLGMADGILIGLGVLCIAYFIAVSYTHLTLPTIA